MILPGLRVGLQEWAVCARALAEGKVCLIVRKGGIHEPKGGLFKPEHDRFVLLPSYLHQQPDRLLPAFRGDILAQSAANPVPGKIPVSAWAEVAQVWKVEDLARVQALGDELMWTSDELAARFSYRSQPWLYVLALRTHRLGAAVDIHDHPSYAGCRSWISLTDPIRTDGSTPAIPDAAFAERLARIGGVLTR
ncbi:MAG: DUF1802 family protein [Planctomycetes bacterium]|nr:DUF1802 family protein [Planctomycetota bacterium]